MSIDVTTLIVTILLGTCGAFLAWREFLHLPQMARQEILEQVSSICLAQCGPLGCAAGFAEENAQERGSNGVGIRRYRWRS